MRRPSRRISQWHRLSYIAVDETRRAMLGDLRVKNLDFIVHGETGSRLLVDMKGRRFPGGQPDKPRRVWQCWCARDDMDGLERWEGLFGADYQGLLVFTYGLSPTVELPDDTLDLWTWRGRRYLFRAVTVRDYRRHMRSAQSEVGHRRSARRRLPPTGPTFARLHPRTHQYSPRPLGERGWG